MTSVKYNFEAAGQDKVEKAFKGIASTADASSKKVTQGIGAQIKALKELEAQATSTGRALERVKNPTRVTSIPGVLGRLTGSSTLTGLQGALRGGSELGSVFGVTGANAMAAGVAVAGLAAGLMVMAGVISKITSEIIVPATREAVRLNEQATGIAIHNRKAGEDMADVNGMIAESRGLAIEHPGLKTNELLDAKGQLSVDFGAQVASELMPTIALLASSTGELPKDIAMFASVMKNRAGISDPNNLRELLFNTAGQMKGTHMSFGAMAPVMDKVVGRGSVLGTGPMAIAQVLGLASMAKSQNPAEFADGLSSALLKIKEHETELKGGKLGKPIHLGDNVGTLADIITGAKGNYEKIKGVAGKNIDPLIPFVEIAQKRADELKKAGASEDSAWATANAELRAAMNASTTTAYEENEAKQDAAARENEVSSKLEAAWQKVVGASGPLADKLSGLADHAEDFIPVVEALIDVFTDLMDFLKEQLVGMSEAGHRKEHAERYNARSKALEDELAAVDADEAKAGSSNPALDKRRERIMKRKAQLDKDRAYELKAGDYLSVLDVLDTQGAGKRWLDEHFQSAPSDNGTGGAPSASIPNPSYDGTGGAPSSSELAAQSDELKAAMKACQDQTQSTADSLGELCDSIKNLPLNRQ